MFGRKNIIVPIIDLDDKCETNIINNLTIEHPDFDYNIDLIKVFVFGVSNNINIKTALSLFYKDGTYINISKICEEEKKTNFDGKINNQTKLIFEAINSKNYSKVIENFNGDNILINDEDEDNIYQVSYLSNQIENLTKVNIGNCENILKNKYNLNQSEELIIIKKEQNISYFYIPIVEYIIFHKNGTELDLNYCSNTTVEYEIPKILNESQIYLHDPQSFYYNDKCYSAESNNVDMTLYDRKNEYNNNNMSLCQAGCNFKFYDVNTKKINCECEIKNKFDLNEILNTDTDQLLNKFKDVKNIFNIDVIKCYKLIFKKNGLLKNYGSYILLVVILISIISSIIISVKEFDIIKEKLQKIIEDKFYIKKNENIKKRNSMIDNYKIIKEKDIQYPPKKSKKKSKRKSAKSERVLKISNPDLNFKNDSKPLEEEKEIVFQELNDYEKNNLPYEKAKIYDKRTYLQYYLSLLRLKQLIIFSFCLSTDYNLKSVKINLFFLTFGLNLTVNALFFNDSTMHKIYTDEGSYNFLFQLPQIIYSLLISVFIKSILSLLSLTEKIIVEFKQKETSKFDLDEYKKFIYNIKIRIIFFYILEIIFLILFWYYISCFCALYRNTQIHLIKDTVTSFAFSLIYPFIVNFIPGILRLSAINNTDNKKYLYKVSQYIQIL